MATGKLALPVLVILLCGLMAVDGCGCPPGMACAEVCLRDVEYMKCKSTGDQRLSPPCNCCVVEEKGCTIYFTDGRQMKCPKTKN